METVNKDIEINRPVSAVYNQWTLFEEFPRFMQGVKSVQQIDDTHLHWEAEIAGREKSWDSEITEQEPDRVIAWRSMGGAANSGRVEFEPVDPEHTRVALTMSYEPEGVAEKVGDAIGVMSARVSGDLKRFKEWVESMPPQTEGWRGEVHEGETEGKGPALSA